MSGLEPVFLNYGDNLGVMAVCVNVCVYAKEMLTKSCDISKRLGRRTFSPTRASLTATAGPVTGRRQDSLYP